MKITYRKNKEAGITMSISVSKDNLQEGVDVAEALRKAIDNGPELNLTKLIKALKDRGYRLVKSTPQSITLGQSNQPDPDCGARLARPLR